MRSGVRKHGNGHLGGKQSTGTRIVIDDADTVNDRWEASGDPLAHDAAPDDRDLAHH